MKIFSKSPSSSLILGFFCIYFCLFTSSLAQNAAAKTDPIEARAVNTIFQRWEVSSLPTWNLSGEICSGSAMDSTSFDDNSINLAIKCDCNLLNDTICRITHLKVIRLNVTGVIPEELAYLTRLSNLNLGQNYLTGPLPAFLGNLTRMQYLNFGANALSGNIPKELGNLQNLISLSFNQNNFSGSLPDELGNLTNLEELYIDSSGVSGEIPSTFASLKRLRIVWASDNQFTGKIPDFIGTWNLTTLYLRGNSFQGSIPSSFSNLTSLSDLRISDLSNGSSNLGFIEDMKDLNILILRNCMISGLIPPSIGDYQSLLLLFLGNNSLTGTLPSEKRTTLHNIDLSYNELSGSLPSWVTQQGLQLNLVANKLVIDSSHGSTFSGLDCLQRNFLCNRGPPRYSSFRINCGGQEKTSSSGTVFERDNEALGAASYYVTDARRWAVSKVGWVPENPSATYISDSLSQFTNTLDPELFQSARLSPGSLRYYGLGLQNGNYTVKLQFADTAFENSQTWPSVGRRIFDIYIQGNLALKDFDIRKEAGGIRRAVQKDFRAQISENFLEIHLFWAGKGTCCIPVRGTYGPSVSAIDVTSDFVPTVDTSPPTPTSRRRRMGLIIGIVIAVGVLSFISVFSFYIWRRQRKTTQNNKDEELLGIVARPNIFSYSELHSATEAFSPANKLGEGGFGPVYKGTLQDGRKVAVKQLSVTSNQGKSQFVTEIATISAVQHRNLVKLFGCCSEGDKQLLVYEYLENTSLDQALFGKNNLHLDWSTRYKVLVGTARALAYLHEDSAPKIVHRDVKSSNILLDVDLNPKISDFGLAKLYDDKKSHISTGVAGTIGYLSPEYAMRGHLTEKVDVFAFGVVALEVLSGRPNADSSLDKEHIYLLEWAWHLHENNRALELVDPTLSQFNRAEAIRVIGVALLCIQTSPMLRPSMSRVVAMLSGDIEVNQVTSKPGYLTGTPHQDISNFISDDGDCEAENSYLSFA